MLRLVCVLTALFTLALGAIVEASPPPIVIESLTIRTEGAGTTLRFTARFAEPFDASAFPQTGSAVVMQQDGQRTKCLNVALVRTNIAGGVATYVGQFNFIYQNAKVLTGRADIGGSIHDFSAPLDGTPGTVAGSTAAAVNAGGLSTTGIVITPQPVVITPDPATVDPKTAAATAAAQRAAEGANAPAPKPTGLAGLATEPAAWLGLIAIFTAAATAYLDRKRALARASAA